MSVVEEYGAFKNSPYGKIAKYFMLMSLYNIYIYIYFTHVTHMRNKSYACGHSNS